MDTAVNGGTLPARQDDARAGVCIACCDSDGLSGSFNCPAAITDHAGGLTSVCLVLSTAAVEVIPTYDLPPSTTS
jgi:hypothetical protein